MDENVQKHRAFVSAVDCASLSLAAERLAYSQSGVSRMIADLEREWGVRLLVRDRAGVRVTADGEAMLPFSRSLVDAHERLREQAEALRGVQTGSIRIGTISSVATHRLPAIIERFQADFPGISYELLLGDYSDIERWLRDGRIDGGFLRAPVAGAFAAIPFERDELRAVLPEGHRLLEGEDVSLEDLALEPFMALEHGADTEVAALFDAAGLTPDTRLVTWDDYAVMAMVERGLGVAILPSLILQRIPYAIETRPLRERAFRDLVFATRKDAPVSLAMRKFMEYLPPR